MSIDDDVADDGPTLPPDPDEPRAKDVIARAGAEAVTSQDELAQLEAWFQRPSAAELEQRMREAAAQLEEGEEPDDFDQALERAYDERQKRIATASAAVTPEAIELLERHTARAQRYRTPTPPAPIIDETILRVRVPSEDEIATIGEGRDYLRAEEIEAALAEAAPQAILRDLFRPVEEFERILRPPELDEDDAPPVVDARAAVLEALAWRPEVPTWDRFADAARDTRERFVAGAGGFWGETAVAAIAAARRAREES